MLRLLLATGAVFALIVAPRIVELVEAAVPVTLTVQSPTCPATAGGIALSRVPTEVRITGAERFLTCSYPVTGGTISHQLMVRWYQTPAPPEYACGLPDNNSSTGNTPYRYRYSQSKAALYYAQGAPGVLNLMFQDGLSMLSAAEAIASGCPRTGAPGAPAATPGPLTPPAAAPVPTVGPTPVPVLVVQVAPDPNVEQLIDLLDKGYGTTDKLIEDALNCARNPKCLGVSSDAQIAEQKRLAREALARISTQLGGQGLVDTVLEEGLATLSSLKRGDGSPAFPAIRAVTPLLALQAANVKLASDPIAKSEAEAELRNTLEEFIKMELASK